MNAHFLYTNVITVSAITGSGETHNYHLEYLFLYVKEVFNVYVACVSSITALICSFAFTDGSVALTASVRWLSSHSPVSLCVCVCLNSQNCMVSTFSLIPTSNRGSWKWTSLPHWHGEQRTHTNPMIFPFSYVYVMCTITALGVCVLPVLHRQMQFEITALCTLNFHHILPFKPRILGKYRNSIKSAFWPL